MLYFRSNRISSPVSPALLIALANNCLHGTRLPNRAHNKKAPLNFRCKLYVSSGGGESLSLSMTGISARTRSVMVWLLKSYRSGEESMNGSAMVRIELTWASTIVLLSWPVR